MTVIAGRLVVTDNPLPQLLTAAQTALALGISRRKLWELTACKEIPHVRIGRSVRYPANALRVWISERQEGGKS